MAGLAAILVQAWVLTPPEPLPERTPRTRAKATDARKRRRVCRACRRWFNELDHYLYHPCVNLRFTVVVMFDFQLTAPPQAPRTHRKCSPVPRAKTKNMGKIGIRQRQAVLTPSLWDVDVQKLRPKTRAECTPAPRGEVAAGNHCRPCPWLSCRHHLALTINEENGSVKENYPHLRIFDNPEGAGLLALEAMVGTCALDIVDEADDGTQGLSGLVALYQAASSGQPIGITAGLTLDETKARLGISVERVRQIGAKAMQDLRVSLRRMEGLAPLRPRGRP